MTYRNRSLLDLCHAAPCLLLPGQHECMPVPSVPCHSDMIRHGRGEHHKSHDCFAVPGCPNAHAAFTRRNLGKEGYHAAWVEAMERFILWKWVSGRIQVTAKPNAGKETSMEPPKCRLCEKNHWAREGCNFGKNTNADRGKAPKGGERTTRRSADSSSSRLTAAESSAGMRPSRPEAIDPAGGKPATIPAATAAHGPDIHAFHGKSATGRARTKAAKVRSGKPKTAPKGKKK